MLGSLRRQPDGCGRRCCGVGMTLGDISANELRAGQEVWSEAMSRVPDRALASAQAGVFAGLRPWWCDAVSASGEHPRRALLVQGDGAEEPLAVTFTGRPGDGHETGDSGQ